MISKILISVIKFYRYFISPLLGSNCRFYPTCSAYAIESIETYGPIKGGRLAIKRILKCHPLHPGGLDPVPSESNDENNIKVNKNNIKSEQPKKCSRSMKNE